jgi:hypothetical protein
MSYLLEGSSFLKSESAINQSVKNIVGNLSCETRNLIIKIEL